MSTTNILDLNNRIDELEKNSGGGGSADSAKRSDIATEFNTTTAYTAGCFVYHEGKLYQFNADHAAGAWDPTDVVEANVTDQIVSNAAAIAGLTANVSMSKIWENSDPTSDFVGQNITGLSLNNYDFIIVTTADGSCIFPITQRGIICFNGSSSAINYMFRRSFTPSGDSTIIVSNGLGMKFSDGSETTFNSIIIPLTIYGIKLT